MKVYNVYHCYDVNGGFGDSVSTRELVTTFESKTDAKAFVEKYSDPYVYKEPYDELYCNYYTIKLLTQSLTSIIRQIIMELSFQKGWAKGNKLLHTKGKGNESFLQGKLKYYMKVRSKGK